MELATLQLMKPGSPAESSQSPQVAFHVLPVSSPLRDVPEKDGKGPQADKPSETNEVQLPTKASIRIRFNFRLGCGCAIRQMSRTRSGKKAWRTKGRQPPNAQIGGKPGGAHPL